MQGALKWAGHLARMEDEKVTKTADAQKVDGKEGEVDLDCDGRIA